MESTRGYDRTIPNTLDTYAYVNHVATEPTPTHYHEAFALEPMGRDQSVHSNYDDPPTYQSLKRQEKRAPLDPEVSLTRSDELPSRCLTKTTAFLVIVVLIVILAATAFVGYYFTTESMIKDDDSNPPVISNCPQDITRQLTTNQTFARITWDEPSATDDVTLASQLKLTQTHFPGQEFAIGVTNVIYTFTDDAGKTSVCNFDIILSTTGDPIALTCPATQQVTRPTNQATVAVNYQLPIPSGGTAPYGTITCIQGPGSNFKDGPTTVICTVSDSGQPATAANCQFQVNVTLQVDQEICNDVSVVGWDSAARTLSDTAGWSIIFSGKPIQFEGVIGQWMYWAKVSQPLRAVVWRPTTLDTVYTVVGINEIRAGVINDAAVYTVPKDQRIEVHQGDFIGVSFSDASPQITYADGEPGAAQVRWYRDSDPSDLSVGSTAITTGAKDRSWSFSAIVIATADQEICNDISVIGWDSAARTRSDTAGWSIIFSGKQIPCDGVVDQWMYWAKVSQPLRAVVWRPTTRDNVYTVVGINDIRAGVINEAAVYTVPKDQRIEVHQGDFIGVSWSDASPQTTFDIGGPGAAQVRWYRDSDPSDLGVGDTAITTGIQDRSWSFSAKVIAAVSDME